MGVARFYPYTELPGDFVANNPLTHAHGLRSTPNLDAISNLHPGSLEAVHTVTVTWTTARRGKDTVTETFDSAPVAWPAPNVWPWPPYTGGVA